MGATTIRDVARQAGVGLGTVSRVLNNSPLVNPATRQRVLAVIADLNYTPSQIARGLSLGRTLTIATIAPFFTRPSVVERLRGIEAVLADSIYDMVVFNVETVERRTTCLRTVPARADGVLVISLPPRPDEVAALVAGPTPVVLIDGAAPGLASVQIDDVAGGELATKFLITQGHSRIGFVGDSLEEMAEFNFTSSRERFAGYGRCLTAHGLARNPAYERHGHHCREEARALARELLLLPEPPTAIFAASDTQALGVLEAARDLGREVPAELSVVGFDDVELAEHLGLTTVRQPLYASGARGVELLLARVDGAGVATSECLPLELVVRSTTSTIALS